MARIETWVNCDLKKTVQVHRVTGNLFTLDNQGNLIGVRVFDNRQPVTLAGTVNGYCILADGTTVPVAGSRSGNTAYIILPQSAYAVPGIIKIMIKLTESSVISTLAAVIGTVAKSRTDQIIEPSQQVITDWSQQIAAEMQAVEDASAAQDTKIDDLKSAFNIVSARAKYGIEEYSGGTGAINGINYNNYTYNIDLRRIYIATGTQTPESEGKLMYYDEDTTSWKYIGNIKASDVSNIVSASANDLVRYVESILLNDGYVLYSGSIANINSDSSADTSKIHVANANSDNNLRLMWYDGAKWLFVGTLKLTDFDVITKDLLPVYNPIMLNYYVDTPSNQVSFVSSKNWKYMVVDVNEFELVRIKTTGYSNQRFDWLFADSTGAMIKHASAHTAGETVTVDNWAIAPENAVRLYVNGRPGYDIKIYKKSDEALTDAPLYIRPLLKIASVNCGTFDHYREGGGSLTPEQYLANWKKIISESDFDLFALVDCPFSLNTSPYTESDLFGGIVISGLNNSSAYDQYMESRSTPVSYDVLSVTSSVTYEGQTYENTNRCKFLRTVFNIGRNLIAVYAIHAAPNSGAGYAALRNAQYTDLINDSKNYDGCIFAGDFNAQNTDEYNIFKNNGFRVANGGYFGTFNTLRSIPADNIIVSPNLLIRSFKMIESPELNSDHLPIEAMVQFVGDLK